MNELKKRYDSVGTLIIEVYAHEYEEERHEYATLQQKLEQQVTSFNDGYDTAKRHYRDQLIELQQQLDKAVEALGWIVGYDGNQHTTRKAEETLKQIKG